MSRGHTEFFGPDLGRGPFSAHRIETAALQIATALAQLRAPLGRAEADVQAHAEFIRGLADRLAPDYAAALTLDVELETSDSITTSIVTAPGMYSLLHCWLTDTIGGGPSATSPGSVVWHTGTIVQTITANRHYLIVTPSTGLATVTVNHSGAHTWRWAISRHGRVFYSTGLAFA
jgi:hypothetical protein